ncbi:phage tail protein [Streptomyces sp. NPDC059378]|uniref:phage tail protein n=1 Tax=Streptomyces sp. NPDC059378 TaxID=3346815 RepID=UPI00368359C3
MRGTVEGLPTPHPLVYQLPAVYLGEDFIQRFLGALDDVLAPVLLTVDNLPAHLDPRTAPEDFLAWTGQWVAADPAPDQPTGQRRAAVLGAMERHRRRGTRGGLAAAVRQEFGTEAEIEETGGTSWSETARSALPGATGPGPRVTVRVRVADPDAAGAERLRRLVAGEVPAHVGYETELLPLKDAS